MPRTWTLTAALLCTLWAASAPAQSVLVSPTGTYLQAYRDRSAPPRFYTGPAPDVDPTNGRFGFTAVDLESLGHRPGDVLSLAVTGGTRYAAGDIDPIGGLRGVTAVFSSDSEVLGRRNRERVPGAVGVLGLAQVFTDPTLRGLRDTDIPQDFLVGDTPVEVEIPASARFLHVAVIDAFLSDNLPGSPPTRLDIVAVPEPAAGLALLLGGVALCRRGPRGG